MRENNKHDEEENESLHTHSYFEGLFHLLHDVASVSQDFQKSQQLGQFYELVHSADPREPYDLIYVRSLKNNLKGYDRQKIDSKPALQIIDGYTLAVFLKSKIWLEESCVEYYEDVDCEKNVLDIINGLPFYVCWVDECNLVGSHETRN